MTELKQKKNIKHKPWFLINASPATNDRILLPIPFLIKFAPNHLEMLEMSVINAQGLHIYQESLFIPFHHIDAGCHEVFQDTKVLARDEGGEEMQ